MIVSPLPKYMMRMNIMSDWGMLPLPSIINQKACKFVLQPMLIKHAKWEPMRLPKYDTGCYFGTIKDTWWTKRVYHLIVTC